MNGTKKLVVSALMLSIALILPFFTGQIPEIGNMLLPMHLPVLLSGFLLGGSGAMLVGAVAPLLRSMLWGMPVLFPKAITMSFELAVYGLVCGLIYSKSKKDTKAVFVSLISSMTAGRIVWGIVSTILYGMAGNTFTMTIFFTEAIINAVPGIVIQIIFIPILVATLKKSKIIQ